MSAGDHRSGTDSVQSALMDFVYFTNSVYGTYLDASMAIGNLSMSYMEFHKAHMERLEGSGQAITPERLNPVVVYNGGTDEQERALHQTTLVDIIQRNAIDGRHMQFLARMCVVALYQFWEENCRRRLKSVTGKWVTHDTFGELRHLRRSVIHRQGRALPELASCKALPRFAPDAEIVLNHAAMEQIVNAVKRAADELIDTTA
jgi:hypothetical protein